MGDLQWRFSAQLRVAVMQQCGNHSKQCRNNAVKLCCAKKSSLLIVPCNITFRLCSRVPYSFSVGRNEKHWYRIGLLFTHEDGDFGAISVTERRYAVPSLHLKWRVTYPYSSHHHGSGSSHTRQILESARKATSGTVRTWPQSVGRYRLLFRLIETVFSK